MSLDKLKSLFAKKPVAPRYTLTGTDKIYLAVAIKHTKKLSFVYTLVCPRDEHGGILMFNTETHVETYDKKRDAEIVYNTAQEMIQAQQIYPGVRGAHEHYANLKQEFLEKTK